MTAERYNQMANRIRKQKYGEPMIRLLSKMIVWVTMGAYVVALLYLYMQKDIGNLYHSILVPAVSFLVVSVFRHIYNQKRPYEELDIEPIIPKEKQGKSFPSRHVFSIFMIAMTWMQLSQTLGVLLIFLGILLAILRVIGGVHYTRDVVAGAILGILCGVMGYYIIF